MRGTVDETPVAMGDRDVRGRGRWQVAGWLQSHRRRVWWAEAGGMRSMAGHTRPGEAGEKPDGAALCDRDTTVAGAVDGC